MHILHRWSLRMIREDHTRTAMVIIAVIAVFSVWVSADFLVISTIKGAHIDEDNTFGISLPSLVSYIQQADGGFWSGVRAWIMRLCQEPFSGDLLANSLFRALNNYLYGGLFIGMCVLMYSYFSVTADECLQDFRILTSSGATARQIRTSLLQRAIGLSLIGAVAGTALGIFTARFSVDPDTFRMVLANHYFILDKRTQLMMATFVLSVPCLMMIAAKFAFRRRLRKEKPLRAPKRGLLRRHAFAQRLFGAGGWLGCLSSRKNLHYRVIFTASFAICLAMLAQLFNLLTVFKVVTPLHSMTDLTLTEAVDLTIDNSIMDNTDLNIECDANSRTDLLDAILTQNADRFGIKNRVTLSEPTAWNDCSFVLFDCAWMNDWYVDHNPELIVTQGGRSSLLWSTLSYIFMDDASFDRIAQDNGIEPTENGALFCNFRYYAASKRVAPLAALPDRDVTLYFLPRSVEEYDTAVSAASFLRAAESEAEKKTIRILGRIDTIPYASDLDRPTLVFPERAFASFADLLSGSKAAYYDIRKSYYIDLSDPEEGIPAFKTAIYSDPRLDDPDWNLFGIEEPESVRQGKHRPITVNDLHDLRYRLKTFQDMLPRYLGIVITMVTMGLCVGILNTAHMNRMTRRRVKAILESIGMDDRQQTGMLLYESARYALNSITLGWLLFTVIFFPIWGDYLDLLRDNLLLSQGQSITFRTLVLFGTAEDWDPYLQAYAEAFGRTWWIFVGGAVLIFVMLIAAEIAVRRRYRREELIKILKDDSTIQF